MFGEKLAYLRFIAALPGVLRERVTIDEARRTICERLDRREERFLETVERGIFRNPGNPYLFLLRRARCERRDLERLVRDRGLEPALASLRQAGVYVSFEEFKGRRPMVRDGATFPVHAHSFDNPGLRRYFPASSGGSTGPRTRVLFDIDHLRAGMAIQMVAEHAHGMDRLPRALWRSIPPSLIAINSMLRSAIAGNLVRRWFTPVWYDETGGAPARLAVAAVRAAGRLAGLRLPTPEQVPLERAEIPARWLRDTRDREGGAVLSSNVSNLVRIADAARASGLDLRGAVLAGGGEPPTPAKVAAIRRSGARHVPGYTFAEGGRVGVACAAPIDENDLHFAADSLALTQHPREVGGVAVDAFHFTSLSPLAPKLLLNVESDDFGLVEERRCGCALEELGLRRHLRLIRSFGKLTGEGMTLVGSDAERVLEEVLPARFGGGPLDYQLLEEEDAAGRTRLFLLVHPRLSLPGGEEEVRRVFYAALAERGGAASLARAVWEQAGTVELRREPPRSTALGKFPPVWTAALAAQRAARPTQR